MQVYTNSKRHSLKIILLFASVLFIAYLPVSTFLFFLKNDAFTGYFPPKFFMSESIHAGYIPLWNPYINFGIPQYGDMSSGYWSPITWLVASTIGYNAYTFTIEVLIYILLGGLGMFKLTGYFKLQTKTRLIASLAFMCSGYNVGHMQHFNWLSGAAFLPWCMWAYLILQKDFSLRNILLSSLLFYFFLSSAHPGLSIGAFYFFLALSVYIFFKNEKKWVPAVRIKTFLLSHLFLIIVLTLLSAGMIIGYLDIIPQFSRGSKVGIEAALLNPTSFQSWLSLLMPFSTTQNAAFFDTDISMRNTYIGLLLCLFFIASLFQKKTHWQKFLLPTGFAFLLLSGGGIFKIFAHKFIPLIGFVRLDGEFRIFSLLCFILTASIQLDLFFVNRNTFKGGIKFIYFLFEIFFAVCIFLGLYKAINEHQSFIYSLPSLKENNISQKLKLLIDSFSFYDTLWIQGCIQMILLWGIKWCLINQNYNFLVRICIADLVIATLLNLPFTGVGKASLAQVQSILNLSPKGLPIPALQPINKNDTLSIEQTKIIGDWSFYNKQIGVTHKVGYPILLKNTDTYFDAVEADSTIGMMDKSFIFIDKHIQSGDSINLVSVKPGKLELKIKSADSGKIVYQQSFYPHWYYNNGHQKKDVTQYGISFFSAPLKKGDNQIIFSFEPEKVKLGMLISLSSFIIFLIFLLLFNYKSISRQL